VASDADWVLREQLAYYDLRVGEYDNAYARTGQHDRGAAANASWRDDMNRLVELFDAVDIGGDVVELAAGTGAWTERLVERATSLTVIDGSEAMLAANRARLGPAADRVTYQRVDLFEWRPDRAWDACVFGFWFCKVPDRHTAAFLDTVVSALRPNGVVCCIDKAAVVDSQSEVIERELDDGRRFTIIDHPRPPHRIVELFGRSGLRVDVTTVGTRFCLASGHRSR
jgi:demethylmenaquinone methyltransferase/2-methoxy-6-polyprenyl-1,4-benzoquinol methylase